MSRIEPKSQSAILVWPSHYRSDRSRLLKRTIRPLGVVFLRVSITGVAHQDGFVLGEMIALAIGLTGVDGVFEVKTVADGVPLDDYVAHDG